MDDEDLEDNIVPSYPWTKERAIVEVLTLATDQAHAIASFFEAMRGQAAADSNLEVDNRVFHAAAAQEIEKLTQPKE